jgi:ribulose-5-phosphate 4-epimerase/fuculose-1-phosphate aldolase
MDRSTSISLTRAASCAPIQFATVLASADSNLPPINQSTVTFSNRYIVNDKFGGLALDKKGECCAAALSDPKIKSMIIGNHGALAFGDNPA